MVTVVVCQSLVSLEDVVPTLDVVSTLYGTEKDIRTSPSFCLRTVCVICCASLLSTVVPPDVDASLRGTL